MLRIVVPVVARSGIRDRRRVIAIPPVLPLDAHDLERKRVK